MPPSPETSQPQDGRRLRSVRSRERIIEALFGLIGEGVLQPTGQQVADRAGLALRTVFRHFADLESLYASLRERVQDMVQPHLEEAPKRGTTEERIAELVRHRCEIFELIAPYERSLRTQLWKSPFLQDSHAGFVRQQRAHLRYWLPEVTSLPVPLQQAVELVVSFDGWDRLRQEQGLSTARTIEAIRSALRHLLLAPRV